MYPILYEEARLRQAELLQEAEQARLFKTARRGSNISRHFYQLFVYRLGDQMEHWGCTLKRFSTVTSMSS